MLEWNDIVKNRISDMISALLFALTFTNICALIERMYAVKYYEMYEKFNKDIPWMAIILLLTSLLLGVILRVLGVFQFYDLQIAIISTLILQIIVIMICFIIMKTANKQYTLNERIDNRLKNKKSIASTTTSMRYQTIENRNVIKLMTSFVIASAIMSFLNVVILLIKSKVIVDLKNVYLENLFSNLVPYFTAIFVPLTIIITEKRYYKKLMYCVYTYLPIWRKKNFVLPLKVISNTRINEEVHMNDETKKEIYFSKYEDQWKGFVRSIFSDLISVALFSTTFTTIGFILERSVALIYFYKYEYFCSHIPYVGIFLILLSWIIGGIQRLITRIYDLNVLFFIFSTGVVQITSQIVCFSIIKTSKKQYNLNECINARLENLKFSNFSIISIKYQTIENKKIVKMMSYFIATTTITTTLDLLSLVIEMEYLFPIRDKSLRSFIGNIIPYVTAWTVPFTVILTEEKLKKILMWYLRKFTGKFIYKTSVTPESMIKNSKLRDEINMPNDKQNEIYFSSYADQWK
uniref:Serpentine receptor class gamma n=1 Tax=Strongyloides papillosus TaxID=174720 RepID=A0A0N5C2R9_STREA